MSEVGLAFKSIAVLQALACYGSFSWAILALFQRPNPTPTAMRWLGLLGTFFFVLQVVILAFSDPPLWFLVAGCTLYAGSLLLFWWAVPYARSGRLALAFSESQSIVVIQEGPYHWIRHPFYAAYLLFWIAGATASSEPWLLVSVVAMGAFYFPSQG